jgi:NitT/TauT family transport system substrate-binding protein
MLRKSSSHISRRRLLQAAGTLAIGSSLGATPGRAANPLSVRLSWLKNAESAGLFVAERKGYYEGLGLKVDLVPGGPQIDNVALVASGTSDVAIVTNPLSILAARARGVPIVVLGCGYQKCALGLAARADRGIKLPQDLRGLKIGYQQVARNLLLAILKANNLSDNDVSKILVTADPTNLIEGRIDLMTVAVLNVPLAMKVRGIEPMTWLAYDLGVPMQGWIVICLESTLASRREELTRFLQGTGRGWAYTIDHPDEVATLITDSFGDGLDLEHQKLFNRGQIPLISTPATKTNGLFWIERSTWETANKVAVETKLIDNPVQLSTLLKPDLLENAGLPKL